MIKATDETNTAATESVACVERAPNLDALAEALGMSRQELDLVRQTEYFPDSADVKNGSGWDVAAIRQALQAAAGMPATRAELPSFVTARDSDGNSVLLIATKGARFDASCPNQNPKGPTHKVRVKPGGTKGRIRHCLCDTCGYEFQTAGEYADVRMEALHKIRRLFESAEVGTRGEHRFIVFTTDARDQVLDLIRRVMKLKDSGGRMLIGES